MAPIRHPNSRIEPIGRIQDMMQLNCPSEEMIDVAKESTKTCDLYTKYLIDCYLELEKQRMEFFKIVGPIFEGIVLPNISDFANHDDSIENNFEVAVQEVQLNRETINEGEGHTTNVNTNIRGSIKNLSFGVVAPKFVCPIEQAACELNVSKATLSLWCRISDIDYWPYRKINSIDNLIRTIQEIGSVEHEDHNGIDDTIKMLEEEKQAIMKKPNLALKDSTLVMRNKMHHLASIRRKRERASRHVADGDLRDKKKVLSLELVARKFGKPIERAAEELGLHKITLQKWCRRHGITSWPYKKIQRITKLLTMVQGSGYVGKDGSVGIIQKLEEEIINIEKNPASPIRNSTLALMKDVTKNQAKRRKLTKDFMMEPSVKPTLDIPKIRGMIRRKEPDENIIEEIQRQAEVADPKTKNLWEKLIAIKRGHMEGLQSTGKPFGDYGGTSMEDLDYDLPLEKVIEEIKSQEQIARQVLNARSDFRKLDEVFMNLELMDDEEEN